MTYHYALSPKLRIVVLYGLQQQFIRHILNEKKLKSLSMMNLMHHPMIWLNYSPSAYRSVILDSIHVDMLSDGFMKILAVLNEIRLIASFVNPQVNDVCHP